VTCGRPASEVGACLRILAACAWDWLAFRHRLALHHQIALPWSSAGICNIQFFRILQAPRKQAQGTRLAKGPRITAYCGWLL
jgi:hypothetical protein